MNLKCSVWVKNFFWIFQNNCIWAQKTEFPFGKCLSVRPSGAMTSLTKWKQKKSSFAWNPVVCLFYKKKWVNKSNTYLELIESYSFFTWNKTSFFFDIIFAMFSYVWLLSCTICILEKTNIVNQMLLKLKPLNKKLRKILQKRKQFFIFAFGIVIFFHHFKNWWLLLLSIIAKCECILKSWGNVKMWLLHNNIISTFVRMFGFQTICTCSFRSSDIICKMHCKILKSMPNISVFSPQFVFCTFTYKSFHLSCFLLCFLIYIVLLLCSTNFFIHVI